MANKFNIGQSVEYVQYDVTQNGKRYMMLVKLAVVRDFYDDNTYEIEISGDGSRKVVKESELRKA